MIRKVIRPPLLAVLFVSALAALVPLVPGGSPAVASAASCYGDYCSGQNPYTTGCSNDAYRWANIDIYGGSSGVKVGKLQMWISKSCGTRWARLELTNGSVNASGRIKIKQSDGYTQSATFSGAGTYYTNMIYNRSLCSTVSISGVNVGASSSGCTTW